MSTETINEDGTPVKIEAVYWHLFRVYAYEATTIEDAIGFLEYGEEHESLASVGVFVDGKPHRVESEWNLDRGRTDEQLLADYALAHRA